ncbi:MAG: hypothetical protein M3548_05330 [Actinomycetota bacterium]|nr:hypothetical protein [Actinomycetota bacterium]
MQWQEQLRELDAKLAARQMSAADYRRQRDDILALASSRGPVRQTVPRGSGSQSLFEEPRPPESTPGVVRRDAPVVGEAVFAQAGRKDRPGLLVLAVLLIIAVAGAAGWWLAFGSAEPPRAAPGFSVESVPNPTGSVLSTSGEFTVSEGRTADLIKEDEVAYLSGGTQRIYFRAAVEDNLSYQAFLFQTGRQEEAELIEATIVTNGDLGGMSDPGIADLPAGVTARRAQTADTVVIRASYVTQGGAVRITILQSGQQDEAKLASSLRHAVAMTLRSLPVTKG